ncbi:MAG: NfeD family protein [Phycisphaerales bacterium]
MSETMLIWGLALLGAALLLTLIEVFVPSGGILGIISIAVAIAGVVCLFRHSTIWGVIGSLIVVIGGPSLFFFALNLLPQTRTGRAMLGEVSEDLRAERELRERESRERLLALVETEGVALTDLHPVGTIRAGGEKHEAVAVASLVDKGQRVRVIGVDMTTLRVRPIEGDRA